MSPSPPVDSASPERASRAERIVDAALLRSMPLPETSNGATKRGRGSVLIIGGSAETPGGALLAAVAALRMGAGKVRIATVAGAATAMAIAVPEARVIGLAETSDGAIARDAVRKLRSLLDRTDALLVGTSTLDVDETGGLLGDLVPLVSSETTVVVDAGAIPVLRTEPQMLRPFGSRAAVIPNATETATMLGADEDAVRDDPNLALDDAVDRLGTVVSLRDIVTRTSGPGVDQFVDDAGDAALGTSGSGDVLAGALTGLAARGADALTAAVWAAHLHGRAGEHLGRNGPGIGTLAREIADALPYVLRSIQQESSER